LVGITRKDYYNVELTEEEKSFKSWIFLDENIIKWGVFDEDLSNQKQSDKLIRWCSSVVKDTEEYFAKFYNSNSSEPHSVR